MSIEDFYSIDLNHVLNNIKLTRGLNAYNDAINKSGAGKNFRERLLSLYDEHYRFLNDHELFPSLFVR